MIVLQYSDKVFFNIFDLVEALKQFNTSIILAKMTKLVITMNLLYFSGILAIGFRDVADRFDVCKSSLKRIIVQTIYFLSN